MSSMQGEGHKEDEPSVEQEDLTTLFCVESGSPGEGKSVSGLHLRGDEWTVNLLKSLELNTLENTVQQRG